MPVMDDRKTISLTPAQQRYWNWNRLNGALQEALHYIREEHGVAVGEPYTLSEDASQLIYTPVPPATIQ